MKILIAPDKFKGTLSAAGVAAAIGRAVRKKFPEVEIIGGPLADGGAQTKLSYFQAVDDGGRPYLG